MKRKNTSKLTPQSIRDRLRKARTKSKANGFKVISLLNGGKSIKPEDLRKMDPELNELKFGSELPAELENQKDDMYQLLFDTSFLYIRRN